MDDSTESVEIPVTILERAPSVDEFARLRASVGWANPSRIVLSDALASSRFAVCLAREGHVIGCGRVIGDGMMFYVQDVIVTREFQGHGYGQQIMTAIMGYLETAVPAGGFVGLMAARGAEDFYTQFGFVARPTPQFGPGMCLVER
ncbi:hypothetical protein SE17_30990 [Kouleothrix aurantiaca]|uniref:N-acetyltransferase domain-containing protein n=1 Tax=Kouleothrix aurantiaca TaxID=186479 RepID=A0A0P9F097_9CHLR|nr:hypothetical protein SE17_30990 [Kouleothrix aurantiaca]